MQIYVFLKKLSIYKIEIDNMNNICNALKFPILIYIQKNVLCAIVNLYANLYKSL